MLQEQGGVESERLCADVLRHQRHAQLVLFQTGSEPTSTNWCSQSRPNQLFLWLLPQIAPSAICMFRNCPGGTETHMISRLCPVSGWGLRPLPSLASATIQSINRWHCVKALGMMEACLDNGSNKKARTCPWLS